MWGGRFSKSIDDKFAYLNNSFRFDWRLYDADIRGSIAYAKALARAGIITDAERDTLAFMAKMPAWKDHPSVTGAKH